MQIELVFLGDTLNEKWRFLSKEYEADEFNEKTNRGSFQKNMKPP